MYEVNSRLVIEISDIKNLEVNTDQGGGGEYRVKRRVGRDQKDRGLELKRYQKDR